MLNRIQATVLLVLLAGCQTVTQQPSLTHQQAAVLRANGFRETAENRWELGIPDRLLFAFNESQLVPRQVDRLRELSHALTGVGIRGAQIEGNTDSIGSADYNRQLSLRRAEVVRQILVDAGMGAGAVRANGLGESNPIESNRTASGRQENRRVVIIVSTGDGEASR